MPILNYTTSIAAAKTVGEIQAMLVKKGASAIQIGYDKGEPISIQFEITTDTLGMRYYNYAPNVPGVLAAMKSDPKVPGRYCITEQARRVAWRIEKDWLQAQFAKIEAMDIPLEKVMLPYMVMPNTGQPLYEAMVQQHKALPQGGK
jgi:hypothetical protein